MQIYSNISLSVYININIYIHIPFQSILEKLESLPLKFLYLESKIKNLIKFCIKSNCIYYRKSFLFLKKKKSDLSAVFLT